MLSAEKGHFAIGDGRLATRNLPVLPRKLAGFCQLPRRSDEAGGSDVLAWGTSPHPPIDARVHIGNRGERSIYIAHDMIGCTLAGNNTIDSAKDINPPSRKT